MFLLSLIHIFPDNLLNLKLICPDINRVLVAENHLCFFLLDQNIQTLQDTRNQLSNIKPFKLYIILTKFQLVQGK